MNQDSPSVLTLTPESVVDMTPTDLRKIATQEIRQLLENYQNTGRARSWTGALVFGLLLPQFFGSARDAGSGCLNIIIPFIGPGHLMNGAYVLWVLQLGLCLGLPFFCWPGYEQPGYAIGLSYALGILFNLLSFFVLKKISFVLRWIKTANKIRRGLTGLHAGTKELIRPFFAQEREYSAFCAELDTREAQYHSLQKVLQRRR